MKKKIKKAFTLVELLVVIAILAILATVSIVGYNSFTKKARVSNDTVLVKQMNDILFANSQTDGANPTMSKALEDVFDGGYDLTKLTPTTTNYNIMWDRAKDQMVLADENLGIVYPEASKVSENHEDLFVVVKTAKELETRTNAGYSVYLHDDFTGTEITDLKAGIDTGKVTAIKKINYSNSNKKDVVIRTNSFATTLTINDSSAQGKIYHYDNLGKLIITDCAMESYHEMGIVGYAELQNGHLAVEENASINLLFANSPDSANLKITNNGTITNAQASSDSVKENATISGVNFNRESGATVSDADIQQSVQETHQSNCEHANIVVSKKAVEATCTQTGLTVEKKCQDCNKILVEQKEVPMIDHSLETVAAVPATCTKYGNIAYKHCTTCGNNYNDNGEILESIIDPATGRHNFDETTHQCTVCKTAAPGWEGFAGKVDATGKLATEAFKNVKSITTIVIPEGVTTIGQYAFHNCTSLESVTIPSTVTKIEDGAFQGCSKLKSVTIPSGVTIISSHAFYECKALSNVTLPDGLTSIGQSAFAYCTALSSISIPNTVKTLGQSAFSESAITSITIPASVTTINTYVFKNCTSLEKVTLNATITQLPNGIFSGCSALKTITIPANVIKIGDAAFQDCRSLASIAIPDNVTSIGTQAFENCTSLTTITIPKNVKTIGKNAFNGAGLATAEFKTTSGWKCTYHDSVNMRDVTKYNITIASGASETNANLLKGSTYNDPSFSR